MGCSSWDPEQLIHGISIDPWHVIMVRWIWMRQHDFFQSEGQWPSSQEDFWCWEIITEL
jgi:hypothetical protein